MKQNAIGETRFSNVLAFCKMLIINSISNLCGSTTQPNDLVAKKDLMYSSSLVITLGLFFNLDKSQLS